MLSSLQHKLIDDRRNYNIMLFFVGILSGNNELSYTTSISPTKPNKTKSIFFTTYPLIPPNYLPTNFDYQSRTRFGHHSHFLLFIVYSVACPSDFNPMLLFFISLSAALWEFMKRVFPKWIRTVITYDFNVTGSEIFCGIEIVQYHRKEVHRKVFKRSLTPSPGAVSMSIAVSCCQQFP